MTHHVQQVYAASELIVRELLASENICLFGSMADHAEKANAIAKKAITERRALFGAPERKALVEDIADLLTRSRIYGRPTSFQSEDGLKLTGMVEMFGEVPDARFYEHEDVSCVTVVINSRDEEVLPGGLSELLMEHGFGSRPNTQNSRIGSWIGIMPNFNLHIHNDGTILFTRHNNDRSFIQGSEEFLQYDGAPTFSQKRTIWFEDACDETHIVCPTARILYARVEPGQQIPQIIDGKPTGTILTAENGWGDLILLRQGDYVDGLQPAQILSSLDPKKILDLTCLFGSNDWEDYGIPDSPKHSAHGTLRPRPTQAFVANIDTIIYLGAERLELSAGDYIVPRYAYPDGLADPLLKTFKPEEIAKLGFVQCSKDGQIRNGGSPKISPKPEGPPGQEV